MPRIPYSWINRPIHDQFDDISSEEEVEKILDKLDIKDIEKYMRKKKLQKLSNLK